MYIRTITYKEGGTVVVNIYLFSQEKILYPFKCIVSHWGAGRVDVVLNF